MDDGSQSSLSLHVHNVPKTDFLRQQNEKRK